MQLTQLTIAEAAYANLTNAKLILNYIHIFMSKK